MAQSDELQPVRTMTGAPRRASQLVLTLLLVALTALAGWAVAPSGASAASRAGSQVSGSVTKQAGPVASRAARGTTHHVTHAQRTIAGDHSGAHSGIALVVIGSVLALVVAARRVRLVAARATSLAAGAVVLRRGRAPPTGVPTPA